jgi:hypothetical protein
MMHTSHRWPVFWATVAILFSTSTAFAQGKSDVAPGHLYGKGQPRSERELPPGQLRQSIEKLPLKARVRAMRWLQDFSFPVEDVNNLRVDKHGGIHYADMFSPGPVAEESVAVPDGAIAADPDKVFKLHSNPGSSNVVFLDFDGMVLENNVWNYYLDARLVALPFDPSNNDNPPTVANFTQDELNRIAEIWHRIAEDFAAFDIDVTTEEPAVFTSTTGRILFTHDVDADGKKMPSQGAGGVAYVNVWGWANYGDYYSPALVYYTNLSGGYPTVVAEAGSHELGHNLGLSHDGQSGGSSYYRGHGSGLVDWAPIMGSAYSRNVTQWSRGEYPNANNPEDDLAIIAEDLGYMADDHGNTASMASPLAVDAEGNVLASSPELDPDNVLHENKGVIDDNNDIDWFYVDVSGSGALQLAATPAWHSFTRSDLRGSNLDIELTLYDPDMDTVAYSEPDDDTFAAVSASVSPGRYYLLVDGVGNNTLSSYSDYASMGMYFIEGSVPTGDAPEPPPPEDVTPPTPSVMNWDMVPTATGTSTIAMSAVTATDESGVVEYNFSCVAGGAGCTDSGWQSSRSYTASGLQADTYYAFKVTARDGFGNENTASETRGATTEAEPAPPPQDPEPENEPPIAAASYTPNPAQIKRGAQIRITLDGSDSYDPDGSISAWQWTKPGGEVIGTSAKVTDRVKEGSHTYTLTVTDDKGAQSSVTVVIPVAKAARK